MIDYYYAVYSRYAQGVKSFFAVREALSEALPRLRASVREEIPCVGLSTCWGL